MFTGNTISGHTSFVNLGNGIFGDISQNNYKIEESQKYNAVPPVEGFDFKPWIDEMGLEALPYQTTIFPIQMNGWSYDYLLATDNQNCPKRGAVRDEIKA